LFPCGFTLFLPVDSTSSIVQKYSKKSHTFQYCG